MWSIEGNYGGTGTGVTGTGDEAELDPPRAEQDVRQGTLYVCKGQAYKIISPEYWDDGGCHQVLQGSLDQKLFGA